jgi:hypothetical protein
MSAVTIYFGVPGPVRCEEQSARGLDALQDAGANNGNPRVRAASWSAAALRRFGRTHAIKPAARELDQGQTLCLPANSLRFEHTAVKGTYQATMLTGGKINFYCLSRKKAALPLTGLVYA